MEPGETGKESGVLACVGMHVCVFVACSQQKAHPLGEALMLFWAGLQFSILACLAQHPAAEEVRAVVFALTWHEKSCVPSAHALFARYCGRDA
jgi:hypothetical protein